MLDATLGKVRIHNRGPQSHGKNSHWVHKDAENAHEHQRPVLIGLEAYPRNRAESDQVEISQRLSAGHTRLCLHAESPVRVGDALQWQKRVDGESHVQREQGQAVHVDHIVPCYLQRSTACEQLDMPLDWTRCCTPLTHLPPRPPAPVG